jgi:hypothetical protein
MGRSSGLRWKAHLRETGGCELADLDGCRDRSCLHGLFDFQALTYSTSCLGSCDTIYSVFDVVRLAWSEGA